MAITISGANNVDKILATDGVLDSISGFNVVGVMTAGTFDVTGKTTTGHLNIGSNIQIGNAGIITATTLVGNVTGNINHTSNLLLQISGSEKFRVGTSGQLGIGGANYGTSGQVLTSGGSGSAPTWSTIASDKITEGNTEAEVVDTGSDGHFKVTTEGSERLRITADGNIGINDNAPANFTGYKTLSIHGSTGGALVFGDDGTDEWEIYGGDGVVKIYDRANTQERIRISDNGAIGLGGANYGSSGQVLTSGGSGSAVSWTTITGTTINNNADNRVITGSGTANTLNAESTLTWSGVLLDLFQNTTAETGLKIRNSEGSCLIRTNDDKTFVDTDELIIRNEASTERLRITSSGQLLMGGNTGYNESSSLISIATDAAAGANMLSDSSAIYNHNNPAFIHVQNRYNTGTGQEAGIIFHSRSSYNGSWAIYGKRTSSNYLSDLIFRNRTGSGSSAERLRIDSSGIVNIGVASPQYAKKVNIQGGNDATLSLSNQDYTGYAAGSQSGIEGRLQCGNSIWSTAGIRFKKFNGTIGDKHTYLELYATDGYSNKVGLVVQPDGEVTKPLQPSFQASFGQSSYQIASNSGADIIFTSEEWDTRSNYNTSNGRFTAPITGKYFFGIQLYLGFSVTAVRVIHSYFTKNGSSNQKVDLCGGISNAGGTHYHPTATGTCMMNLSANDYVTFNIGSPSFSGSGNSFLYPESRFFGYLIG